MNHPILIQTNNKLNSLTVADDILQKLLDRPRPILWKREEKYYWIPIEKIRTAIKWYSSLQKDVYPPPKSVTFVIDDCVPIPKIVGDIIFKYNGHKD